MEEEQAAWEDYEEVAVHLLNRVADHLGLEYVEEKQEVEGASGTTWEIDGKGVEKGEEGFVILECRRYPTSRVSQEEVGGLAFRISDTGAEGGIIVTPIGLQEGAEKVAEHTEVETVELDENSTTKDYMMRFLDNVFVGFSDTLEVSEERKLTIRKVDDDQEDGD